MRACMTSIQPNAIRPGDTIGIVVPAGPIDRERVDRAIARLHQLGYQTKTYGDIYRASGYLAGDDETRAAELMAAFADSETTAVWCARGGYGVARLLDRLDYDTIRRHPKAFVGFSDITALHLAIQNRVGLVTFHGPNLQDGFGRTDDMSPAMQVALWDMLGGADSAATVRSLAPGESSKLQTLSPGIAAGRLTGGNLSVLCGLMGTPYEVDTRDRVLFLEDVDEPPYRVDRFMAQLSLAGKLQSAAGILLGSFTSGKVGEAGTEAAIASVLCDYCDRLDVPVVAQFPAGHGNDNFVLPMSALVQLDADQGRVTLLENIVSPGGAE